VEAEVRNSGGGSDDAAVQPAAVEQSRESSRVTHELCQLASFLSHELRQPLGALHIWTELLETSYGEELDERGRRYLREIGGAARSIAEMVSAQIGLLRISSLPLELERFALVELLDEVLTALKGPLEAAQARVEVGSLPALVADRAQMVQLFRHLIENAIRYRRSDLPLHVHVSASAPADGSCWSVWVRDNGSGFPVAEAEGVLEHCTRLDPAVPGSGVELAICRRIARRHGGTVRAEGRPGEGVCFVLELPAERCSF
jgi:signal transduction histidine kinase